MHILFINAFFQITLSSTCFEQLSVLYQEGFTSSFTVFYHASI